MEQIRKTVFDPLATTKADVGRILQDLPPGTAHPFSPERLLLCRTEAGVEEIDISKYPDDFFFNAVDLGEMGETLLRRMAGFPSHLRVFEDFHIQQAPASTFRIPLVADQITILAVSERTPTYWDFCFADAQCNTCCWVERTTFPGIAHSGDMLNGNDLLDYVRINKDRLTDKEICVFISGYQITKISRFLGTHPAMLVANHQDKVLYTIPVPLDAATIGDATICCPLVVKRDGDSLVCSILPTATTDGNMMCDSRRLKSAAFPEAIQRANFEVSTAELVSVMSALENAIDPPEEHDSVSADGVCDAPQAAVFLSAGTKLPRRLDTSSNTQIIRFGNGIEFQPAAETPTPESEPCSAILPCIFGSRLEGPLLLATGTVPLYVPFRNEHTLRNYYKRLKNVVFIVNDQMTDNARNLAGSYRINALFIVQLSPSAEPKTTDEIHSLLNSANINAVTALAGPQSLVLVQISDSYYFYRGIANRARLETSGLAFGADVTAVLGSAAGMWNMLDPRVPSLVNLDERNSILLPSLGRWVPHDDLEELFRQLPVDEIKSLEGDINAAVPQLQMLLNEKELRELSKSLVSTLSARISNETATQRDAYIKFRTHEYRIGDVASTNKRDQMLGSLRKRNKQVQQAMEPAITSLANMMSTRATSKRTHDLKRLVRQAHIQSNVDAAKSMTFDTLAGYLETYAGDVGVMLLNIDTSPYSRLLGSLQHSAIDASSCCHLDSRILHLEGLDAGLVMEMSQNDHDGPLKSQAGPLHPTLAVPWLGQHKGSGSMLAWVCWDEFVELRDPYSVRWMEKCNETHIAALRIVMRDTLSQAVASREHNLQPSSPETGQLMSALLMAAMAKLAAMRTVAPVVAEEADTTATKLMRGLFGNLLTMAGSGVQPLSMVWQLFGVDPSYDIPTTPAAWLWYENTVALYPYTGWPLERFHDNLAGFLDKVIIRVVTQNENQSQIKKQRTQDLVKYCKLRNIQLQHSRTIIVVLMRMLADTEGEEGEEEKQQIDVEAIASRLLEHLPHTLSKQTAGYTRLIGYLKHLAAGNPRRAKDDILVASTYTKRSAAFRDLKSKVAASCKRKDWSMTREHCQSILDKHSAMAAAWKIAPASFQVQNMLLYKEILDANFKKDDDDDQESKLKKRQLIGRVLSDAETERVPWQVGKHGEFGCDIEPLDEAFVEEIVTGKPTASLTEPQEDVVSEAPAQQTATTMIVMDEREQVNEGFVAFKSKISPHFIATMRRDLSPEYVCNIIKVPLSTMHVFVQALNPTFQWEKLGFNFKVMILDLLQNRSKRIESRPVRKLLDIGI